MGATQVITRYAAKPFKAEHPIGSGNIVQYQPGDVVPAGDWGPAANWLKEAGKIFEGATVVYTDDEALPVSTVQQVAVKEPFVNDGSFRSGPPVNEDPSSTPEDVFPQHIGFGSYRLSNGENIKGLENATEAQAAITHPKYTSHPVTPDEDPSQFELENFPISRQGGYLLSNGEIVSGREHAKELQASLTAHAQSVDETAPVEEFAYPVHEGAGYFRLSDGSRVRGKQKALDAESNLGGTDG